MSGELRDSVLEFLNVSVDISACPLLEGQRNETRSMHSELSMAGEINVHTTRIEEDGTIKGEDIEDDMSF